MTERSYTVKEIDRMRISVDMITRGPPCYLSPGTLGRFEWEKLLEERLRTYMLAGVSQEDLEFQASELEPQVSSYWTEYLRTMPRF